MNPNTSPNKIKNYAGIQGKKYVLKLSTDFISYFFTLYEKIYLSYHHVRESVSMTTFNQKTHFHDTL
jgi:hypothetical protein